MSTSIRDLLAESLLPSDMAPDLEPVLVGIEAYLPDEAPTPSSALAALMAHPPDPGHGGPRQRLVALACAAVVSSVGMTGAAAAASALPEPVQHLVVTFTHNVLPFVDAPQPPEQDDPENDPAPAVVPVDPSASAVPGGSPATSSGSTAPSASASGEAGPANRAPTPSQSSPPSPSSSQARSAPPSSSSPSPSTPPSASPSPSVPLSASPPQSSAPLTDPVSPATPATPAPPVTPVPSGTDEPTSADTSTETPRLEAPTADGAGGADPAPPSGQTGATSRTSETETDPPPTLDGPTSTGLTARSPAD